MELTILDIERAEEGRLQLSRGTANVDIKFEMWYFNPRNGRWEPLIEWFEAKGDWSYVNNRKAHRYQRWKEDDAHQYQEWNEESEDSPQFAGATASLSSRSRNTAHLRTEKTLEVWQFTVRMLYISPFLVHEMIICIPNLTVPSRAGELDTCNAGLGCYDAASALPGLNEA